LPHHKRQAVAKAFLQALRSNVFPSNQFDINPRDNPKELCCGTVKSAAYQLASTFRCHNRESPFHQQGDPHKFCPLIQRLFNAWTRLDPPPRKSAALNPEHLLFLHTLAQQSTDPITIAHTELLIGVFFFACRSCEYSWVERRGRTRILTLADISFSDANAIPIDISKIENDNNIELVNLHFSDQKNGEQFERRSHHRSGHPVLCPVNALLRTARRLLSYNTGHPPSINDFIHPYNKSVTLISQKDTNNLLRFSCSKASPPTRFGYSPEEVSSHSLRSGAAMAMFRSRLDKVQIMQLGRWHSDAFLDYLRPNNPNWTEEMSRRMITSILPSSTSSTNSTVPTTSHHQNHIYHNEHRHPQNDTPSSTHPRVFPSNSTPPSPSAARHTKSYDPLSFPIHKRPRRIVDFHHSQLHTSINDERTDNDRSKSSRFIHRFSSSIPSTLPDETNPQRISPRREATSVRHADDPHRRHDRNSSICSWMPPSYYGSSTRSRHGNRLRKY
jgi:hypothetical protein